MKKDLITINKPKNMYFLKFDTERIYTFVMKLNLMGFAIFSNIQTDFKHNNIYKHILDNNI